MKLTAIGIIITIPLAALVYLSNDPAHGDPFSDSLSKQKTSATNRRQSEYISALAHLRKFTKLPPEQQNHQLLIENVGLLHKSGELVYDETLEVYLFALQVFTDEELESLVKAWPVGDMNSPLNRLYRKLGQEIAKRNKIELLHKILKAMPENANARDHLLRTTVQKMESFTPSNLKTITNNLTSEDKNSIGEWLIARIENSAVKFSDRLSLLNDYSKESESVEINKHLLNAYVEWESDPIKALNWIKQSDPQVSAFSDKVILEKIAANYPNETADYINDIIATGDKQRITNSIQTVVTSLQGKNPEGALEWGRKAYGEFTTDFQVIGNPFAKLYQKNPAKALKYAQNEADPEVKKTFLGLYETLSNRK